MLQKLVERWKARGVVKALERHPIHGAVLINVRAILNDRTVGLGKHWTDEGKQTLISNVIVGLDACLAQPNPAQSVRMRLIELTLLAARFQVLVLEPPVKVRGLSGELRGSISSLRRLNKDLEAFFYGLDEPAETEADMWDAVLMRYWVLNLYMNAYNTARIALGDYHADPTKDWFTACYASFCIWQEYIYRNELGLPPVVDGEKPDLRAIVHSTWFQRAEEGHKELRLAWERSWREAFSEPSPFDGVVVAVT